jgi:hypothetical protein
LDKVTDMEDIRFEVDGPRLIVDFSQTGLSLETVEDRARDVFPLLAALLAADGVWQNLTASDQQERLRGYAAMNMVCQARIIAAVRQAELLAAITAGDASIADHGFPEFQNGDETAI